jgi:hypothetical protein
MRKGDPGYTVKARRTLFAEPGTQLRINRLLEGIRSLSGEKIQWYLAAELRDRLRLCGVRITVIDKIARKQYAVEPRQYEGRLLHHLPAVRATAGDVYVELYVNEPKETNRSRCFDTGHVSLKTLPWLINSRSRPGPHVIFKVTSMRPSLI